MKSSEQCRAIGEVGVTEADEPALSLVVRQLRVGEDCQVGDARGGDDSELLRRQSAQRCDDPPRTIAHIAAGLDLGDHPLNLAEWPVAQLGSAIGTGPNCAQQL